MPIDFNKMNDPILLIINKDEQELCSILYNDAESTMEMFEKMKYLKEHTDIQDCDSDFAVVEKIAKALHQQKHPGGFSDISFQDYQITDTPEDLLCKDPYSGVLLFNEDEMSLHRDLTTYVGYWDLDRHTFHNYVTEDYFDDEKEWHTAEELIRNVNDKYGIDLKKEEVYIPFIDLSDISEKDIDLAMRYLQDISEKSEYFMTNNYIAKII